VPFLIAAIGCIIEQHMVETGFIAAPKPLSAQVAPPAGRVGGLGMLCPRCSQPGVSRKAACLTCTLRMVEMRLKSMVRPP
jgi:ribonucleoside-diphosphate reductase alpha chain